MFCIYPLPTLPKSKFLDKGTVFSLCINKYATILDVGG